MTSLERALFGSTRVEVIDLARGYLRTTLPDGTLVYAEPNFDADSIERAHALGYGGDVVRMTIEHDPLHVIVANVLGMRESAALRNAVEGVETALGRAEESVVLAMQRLINLYRATPRPHG